MFGSRSRKVKEVCEKCGCTPHARRRRCGECNLLVCVSNCWDRKLNVCRSCGESVLPQKTGYREEKGKEGIRLASRHFDTVAEAAEHFGVRKSTIENWVHWLKYMPPKDRKKLVREIEVRGLDYANDVIGTEEEEERKEEDERKEAVLRNSKAKAVFEKPRLRYCASCERYSESAGVCVLCGNVFFKFG